MSEYSQLAMFAEVPGNRVWKRDVHGSPGGQVSQDEKQRGPVSELADGIYVVTVSENTPPERFRAAHRLNLVSEPDRRKQCTLAGGFLPGDSHDTAIAVVNSRIVGGIVADRGRACFWRQALSDKSSPVSVGYQSRPCVMYIWVHPKHRRMGIGRQLQEAIAAHFDRKVSDLGHWFPIKPKAKQLLRSMGIEEVFGFK